MKTHTIKVEGMSCMHCAARVKEALEELGCKAEVSLEKKTVVVSAPVSISREDICAAINATGYKAK